MRMYSDLARWWPLLSPPLHYDKEAEEIGALLRERPAAPPRTLLELGAGGGSLAWHFKNEFRLTLTDISPGMLAVSKATNPECEHIEGDMYALRLNRLFDAVLVHDAIMYATSERNVRHVIETARVHCREGGVLVMAPDCVRETFKPYTDHGGEDGPDGRGLRYVEWVRDDDPDDCIAQVSFGFLLRESDGSVHVDSDQQNFGIFPRADWLAWLEAGGFAADSVVDSFGRDLMVGIRRG
jgi:SAM-dependent methyltransferase